MKAYQMLTPSGRLLVICCLFMACTAIPRREIYMLIMSNGTQVSGHDLSVTSDGRISVRDTRYQGYGVVSFTNGDDYYGEFRDGKRHGFGVYVDLHREACQAGRWVDGDFVGMPAIAIAPGVPPPSLPIYRDVSAEEITQAKQMATQFFDDAVEIEEISSYYVNFGQYRFIKVIGIQRHSGTNRVTEHVLLLTYGIKIVSSEHEGNPDTLVFQTFSDVLPNFKLTEQSFNALRDDNVPEDVLKTLQPLENKKFLGVENLLYAIKKHIGGEQTARYMTLILNHACILAVDDYRQRDLREFTIEGHLFRIQVSNMSNEEARGILTAFLKKTMILDNSQKRKMDHFQLSASHLDAIGYYSAQKFKGFARTKELGYNEMTVVFQRLPCSDILRILEVGIITRD